MTALFPLTAIVGQDALVEALLVNAVCPAAGGVLVRGERGTAKSTAVRALAPLMPAVGAAADQPFAFMPGEVGPFGPLAADAAVEPHPAPLVELPLAATLDRLVGALDLGRALDGERAFEPGLLARAHRGILYVDEVNLLPDHLVDALLDAAATSVVRVERDAISIEHDARFLLVGTMNIEEGDLRPQLLDRFGLSVDVRAPQDPADRAEIVRRRQAFETDPDAFRARFVAREEQLAERIALARERFDHVALPERELMRITRACVELGIEGARGDITCALAARALAALNGADEVGEEHVRRAAVYALPHRCRRDPLEPAANAESSIDRAFGDPPDEPPPRSRLAEQSSNGSNGAGPEAPPVQDPALAARARRDAPIPAALPHGALALTGKGSGPQGRRGAAGGAAAGSIDSRPAVDADAEVALVPSLLARLAGSGLREHVRAGREGALLCLVVDASGSMGARRRAARVKGALLELLRDAYARRDRVMLLVFSGDGAELVVDAGAPLETAAEAIRNLSTGGATPLAAGLQAAGAQIRRAAAMDPSRRAIAVVFTDGRAVDEDGSARAAAAALGKVAAALHVVDTEDSPVRIGLAAELARAGGGSVHELCSNKRRAA